MRHKILSRMFALAMAVTGLASTAPAQDANQDEIDPRLLRRFWMKELPVKFFKAAPYVLTDADRAKFKGTFGIDLSHYSFDIKNNDAKCGTANGYNDPACSCTANWQVFLDNKILYIYSKASDASHGDLSFPRVWKELEAKHVSKALYRGGYHFLRPGVDADKQADAFLQAVGAINGKKPEQLPPIVDIEWSNKLIVPGTPEYAACPVNRRTKNDKGNWYCDMWYTMTPAEIGALAKKWIDRVEAATGRPVIIYTNPTGWWNSVMTPKEDALLLKSRAVWTSRYTSAGPKYDPKWTKQGGSPKWQMAPLPRGASYPEDTYSVAHFWQFTDNGYLPSDLFTCKGKLEHRDMDMNWVPVSGAEYPPLFGVGGP